MTSTAAAGGLRGAGRDNRALRPARQATIFLSVMILYRLRCADGHEFDSWFKDSKTYERQEKKSLIGCAVCGSAKVERALMAAVPGLRATIQLLPSDVEAHFDDPRDLK